MRPFSVVFLAVFALVAVAAERPVTFERDVQSFLTRKATSPGPTEPLIRVTARAGH